MAAARSLARTLAVRRGAAVATTRTPAFRSIQTVPKIGTEAEMQAEAIEQVRARIAYQKEVMAANPHKSHEEEWTELWTWIKISIFIGGPGCVLMCVKDGIIEEHHHRPDGPLPEYMAIATKDIAGCTRIRELGNPAGLEAAASGAILGGLIGGMSQLMVGGNSKRPSVLKIVNDETLSEEEKVLAFSKRPSIIAQVADHNVTRMDKSRLEKISASLVPGSSAIVCVFDEVLVQQSVYETKMKDHKTDMDDLTDHVTTKIHEQLRNGNDVAFHVVVDDATGEISWTRTVIGD